MKKIIIFDLFNTLIYNDVKEDPYLCMFKDLGFGKNEISYWIDRVITKNYSSFKHIYEDTGLDIDLRYRDYNKKLSIELENTKLFDDTISSLEALSKHYRLFCLSNIATPYKQAYFDLKLNNYIEKEFFSCDIGLRKPDKELFDIVISYSGANLEDITMIGDSYNSDYKGALNAGIKAILKNRNLSEIIKEL